MTSTSSINLCRRAKSQRWSSSGILPYQILESILPISYSHRSQPTKPQLQAGRTYMEEVPPKMPSRSLPRWSRFTPSMTTLDDTRMS